jgi:hypothetical protein
MIGSSIDLAGTVLSREIIEKIQNEEGNYQKPTDFHLSQNQLLRDAIGGAWTTARAYWQAFQTKAARLDSHASGASETRSGWIIPLLSELGYEVENLQKAPVIDDKTYAISHKATSLNGFPVHIMGINDDLDKKRNQGGPRLSPHGLMQEYLNNTEHLFGLVTNGYQVRLLRDTTKLSRLAYVEFDLRKMMEEELYADFTLFYRLLHASRMPATPEEADKAIVEQYHQEAIESGARIRDKLRDTVKGGMEAMANGLLQNNPQLAQHVRDGHINTTSFYDALLRSMYRLLFLTVIEERDLVFPPDDQFTGKKSRNWCKQTYQQYYSIERLRRLVEKRNYIDGRKQDLWQSLNTTFALFENRGYGEHLGIYPLDGALFREDALTFNQINFRDLTLDNATVLRIIKNLSLLYDEKRKSTIRVNYSDLDVEELGAVYEALLDLAPAFYTQAQAPSFGFVEGTERKSTGSYYTRHDLVMQLIQSALDPVIADCVQQNKTPEEQEKALLDLKVCDPATGSGHFLLAAGRRIGEKLAQVRTGEGNPGKEAMQQAKREAIEQCLYGVDKNPYAVELCQLSLWLEGHNSGKPISFLDHKIKTGDALVGVSDLEMLKQGISNEAFKAKTGDENEVARKIKKQNQDFNKKGQSSLFQLTENVEQEAEVVAESYEDLDEIQTDSVDAYRKKEKLYQNLQNERKNYKIRRICDLYCYAFFQPLNADVPEREWVTSQTIYDALQNFSSVNGAKMGKAVAASTNYQYFHWPAEFPDVSTKGGFDAMIGNPPWDVIEFDEKEFFQNKDDGIATTDNKAERTRKINQLSTTDPRLYQEYYRKFSETELFKKFINRSRRYKKTIEGKLNKYSIFTELKRDFLNTTGCGATIVQTGLVTDNDNKKFFKQLIENHEIISLYDFENKKNLFPIHTSQKFMLLSFTIDENKMRQNARFGFFLHEISDVEDDNVVFKINSRDFKKLNPNTENCPIFRTSTDADLTKKIYTKSPILINDKLGTNPWSVGFKQGLFNMSTDSHLFKDESQLKADGYYLKGNRFINEECIWLPLYESKMISHYDHRFGTFEEIEARKPAPINRFSTNNHLAPERLNRPWYWVKESDVNDTLITYFEREEVLRNYNYFIGFRNNARNTDARTLFSSFLPKSGVGNSMPLILTNKKVDEQLFFLGCFNSIVLDYSLRQKISGANLNFFIIKQLPVPSPQSMRKEPNLVFKTFELAYNSWDIKALADDFWIGGDEEMKSKILNQWHANKQETGGHKWELPDWKDAYPENHWHSPLAHGDDSEESLLQYEEGCPLPPFKWDEERRARLRAEIDAIVANLYGLTREELHYILDPKEVYGEDFPGETFRVLKENEIKEHGEFKTKRLVLEAWDRLVENGEGRG